jgi:malate dehydrogenase (oxaloacetate-decarboxylating)(NADP+)
VARLLVRALQARGLAEYQARSRIWLIDSKGLIYKGRPDLTPEKAAFAQDLSGPIGTALGGPNAAGRDAVKALPRWIEAIQPSALIGAAAVGGAFTQPAVEALVQVRVAAGKGGGSGVMCISRYGRTWWGVVVSWVCCEDGWHG